VYLAVPELGHTKRREGDQLGVDLSGYLLGV
jgi:hypothetical protein